MAIILVKAFDLQIIDHSYYSQQAQAEQLSDYAIPAERGLIEAHENGSVVPIVLNQKLYTLFGDPPLVKKPQQAAAAIASAIGGNASTYRAELTKKGTQYVVLAKEITQAQSSKILSYKYQGVDTQGQDYRTYPDGDLAEPVLGFVNNNGVGEYGVEQAMNKQLAGTPGRVKAVTDVNGVPLAANAGNVEKQPVNGKNVVLTLQLGVQEQLEQILSQEMQKVHSNSGSALVMNINTGAIEAMADFPNYNPAQYDQVTNSSVFDNAAVATPLEPGSVMKTLTTSAALDTNSITPNETFYDPARWPIDGSVITDISQDGGPQERSITDILVDSLNTGATWELMQMGGGQINAKARDTWYDYMVNHFHLGTPTGIEQGYEASGYVPQPENNGSAIDLTYANTAFGQAVTVTPLQLAAALSAVLNGGTYYVPHLVEGTMNANGVETVNKPQIWKKNIVKPTVGPELEQMMESVINDNYWFYQMQLAPSGYIMGGKTGTAQVAKPNGGGYYANVFNGTFIGFVGGSTPQYVIMVEVNDPNLTNNSIDTYAGAGAAAPIFGQIAHMLINQGVVNPAD